MDCHIAREALSARIDGEREPIPAARVDEHLAGCAPCRDWQSAAIDQTRLLRQLTGRSQVAAVRAPTPAAPATSLPWQRWALAVVGGVQLGLAIAQGLGAHLGLTHPEAAEHVLNESTAWSAALGVVMLVAAVRPVLAGGLTWVLATFGGGLLIYEIVDGEGGRVTLDRTLTHLPVLAGALLALLVWRRARPAGDPRPDRRTAAVDDEIVLPDNASRGRRRSHLRAAEDGTSAQTA